MQTTEKIPPEADEKTADPALSNHEKSQDLLQSPRTSGPVRNKAYIHANEITMALSCPKRALLNREGESSPFLLPDKTEYFRQLDLLLEPYHLQRGQTGDTPERSLQILREDGCGRDLRFQSGKLRTTIPLLFEKEDGTYQAIYPVCSVHPKESLLPLLFTDQAIAEANGVIISEHTFLYLDKQAKRQKDSRPSDFFKTETRLKKMHGGFHKISADAMLEAMKKQISNEDFRNLVTDVFEHQADDYASRKVKACTSPSRCPFYSYCWKDDQLPDDSALLLTNFSNRDALVPESARRLKDLSGKEADGNPMQYAQIQADRLGGCFMDVPALQTWMDTLVWPITYLDFEWDTFALPPYEGMKPFDVLCFQYSMHIEQKDGTLEHSAFYAGGDCRKAFIEHLLEEIPASGSIMVFNMEGAEKLRLMQLAEQFEEYRKPLEVLCERMVDLSLPFENGAYYDLRQRGKSSLKTLLPLFSDHDGYESLDVHNGMEAVFAYRKAGRSDNPAEAAAIAEAISDYCSMDTYAERELFLGLQKKLEQAGQNAASEQKITAQKSFEQQAVQRKLQKQGAED